MASHDGMTTEEFAGIASDWIGTARHPTLDRPILTTVYQPMLELLDYLRANGFKTFIVSGGGIEFMRPWTEAVYGIPPEQVVGSSIRTVYEVRDGVPVKAGDRIGDVDPRGATEDLDHISDKSHRVAEGVHEALLGLLAEQKK